MGAGAVGLSLASSAVAGIRRGTGNCVGKDEACAGKDRFGFVGSAGSGDCSVVRRTISESSMRHDERRGGVGIVRA